MRGRAEGGNWHHTLWQALAVAVGIQRWLGGGWGGGIGVRGVTGGGGGAGLARACHSV